MERCPLMLTTTQRIEASYILEQYRLESISILLLDLSTTCYLPRGIVIVLCGYSKNSCGIACSSRDDLRDGFLKESTVHEVCSAAQA
jgi:hypothetical protein